MPRPRKLWDRRSLLTLLPQAIKEHPYCVSRKYTCNYGGLDKEGKPHVINLTGLERMMLDDLYKALCFEFPIVPRPPTVFEQERETHRFTLASLVTTFLGRQDAVDESLRYLTTNPSTPRAPLVVTGPSGWGKSSLCAVVSARAAAMVESVHTVLPHFVGCSPDSTNIRAVLLRLCDELQEAFGASAFILDDSVGDADSSFASLRAKFWAMLQQCGRLAAARGRLVVIIIDGLDLLAKHHGAQSLDWLPQQPPVGCRIMLSTVQQSPAYEAILHRAQLPQFLELPPLTRQESQDIVATTLAEYGKKLTGDQMDLLLSKPASSVPLYVCGCAAASVTC